MKTLKLSTARNVMVFMADSTDHVTGKISLTLTITSSKDGAAFASISPTVTERGNGWYNLALTAGMTDTLGDLILRATGTAADPSDIPCMVQGGLVDADMTSRMATYTQPTGFLAATFPGTVASTTNITAGTITTLTNLPTIPANWLTAAGIAASALNGKGDWNIGKTGYTLTATTGLGNQTANITGTLSGSVGSVTGLTAANLDVAVSTRMATFTQPTGFLAATFPAGTVANTTNIAAGTITTVTTLTGHTPQTGDAFARIGVAGAGLTALGDTRIAFLDKSISEIAIAGGSSALNKLAASFTLTAGSVVSGTFTDTFGVEQTYHRLADTAGTLDAYYEFDIGFGTAPVSVAVTGRVSGNNDSARIMGYRWSDTTWVQVGLMVGNNGTADTTVTGTLFKSMVGTGANAGKVRIRLYNTGLTSSDTYVDQISIGYINDASTLIYAGAAQSATSTTVVLPSTASAVNNFYFPALVVVTGGTGIGQSRRVDGYVGSTKTLTVATAWATNPDTTSEISIYPWASVRVSDMDATVVAAIHDEIVDGSTTFRQSTRLQNAALLGKASGLATTTATYRDLADTKNRIVATVDADGNRSAVTKDSS